MVANELLNVQTNVFTFDYQTLGKNVLKEMRITSEATQLSFTSSNTGVRIFSLNKLRTVKFFKYEGGLESFRSNKDTRHFFRNFFST